MTGRLTRSFWVRALVTAAVLGLLVRSVDLDDAFGAIGRLDVGTILAVGALLAVDRMVMVWRWIALLRAAGQPIPVKSATWIYLVSSFVGGFLVAGVGGDVARAYTLSQRTSQGGPAIASVAADRLLGLVAILLVGLIGAAFWRRGEDANVVLMVGAGFAIAGAIGFLWADSWARLLIPAAIQDRRIGIRLLRYADALSAYRGHRGTMLFVLGLSIGVQLLRIVQAYLLGQGIGIDCPARLLPGFHADWPDRAASTDLDQRFRCATGHHRLAADAGGGAPGGCVRAVDADRSQRYRRQYTRGNPLPAAEKGLKSITYGASLCPEIPGEGRRVCPP